MSAPQRLVTLGLLALVSCTAPQGQLCSSGSQCPVNSYCMLGQCIAPSTVSEGLAVVVRPSDPSLPPQQFLPNQFQTVDGFSVIILRAAQILDGPVILPPNCGDAGYPVQLQFTGPSLIAGVRNSFQFESDENGNVFGSLPVGAYVANISPAVACTSPLTEADVARPGTPFDLALVFAAPIVGQEEVAPPDGGEDGGELTDAGFPIAALPSLDIAGQIQIFVQDAGPTKGAPPRDAGLPIGATVRILALADAGAIGGERLSGDQPLQFIDGGLWFGSTFVPGGPAALPVTGPPAPGIIRTPDSKACVGAFGSITQAETCDQFVIEIGPSRIHPFLTTFDIPVNAPELDAGANLAVLLLNAAPALSAQVTLPVNPMLTFNVPVLTELTDTTPLPSAVVSIASVKDGIEACQPPSGGIECHLAATAVTDPNHGTLTFPVLPGRYVLTLNPPSPKGSTTTVIDVLDAGQLQKVSGTGSVMQGSVVLIPADPVQVSGIVREPGASGGSGALLPRGQVEVLTISDLAPVAIGQLANGAFSLLVPAGQYELIIQPDSTTRLPTYHTTITANESLPPQSYVLSVPGLLSGIVVVLDDAGLPLPAQAELEFYDVTTDPDGGAISFPVANAVTDSQGRWSAAGPPAK